MGSGSGSESWLRVKTVEEIQILVTPPKSKSNLKSKSKSCLPLTFLDIPWLMFPAPYKPLFFFQLEDVDADHVDIVLKLKKSLSCALHHFFPLASRLTTLNTHDEHGRQQQQLVFSLSSGSVPLKVAVAECTDAVFTQLCSYQPRDAATFHLLVPHLPTIKPTSPSPASICTDDVNKPPINKIPLLAIQITCFPKAAAFSIGLSCHPVICDQRTFHLFLSTWASLCKDDLRHHPLPLPSFDRSVILDPTGLDLHSLLLKHCHSYSRSHPDPCHDHHDNNGMLVRATFVMGTSHIEKSRLWIQSHCEKTNTPHPVLLSPYVLTCALVWSCFTQAQAQALPNSLSTTNKGSMFFGFIAGGLTRLNYPVPTNFFGNCVTFGRAIASREQLLAEEDGFLTAARAIAQAIRDLDVNALGQAHNWIPDWQPIIGPISDQDLHIHVVGSPKVELYKTDFGWGTPRKIEDISIDDGIGKTAGMCASLTESRDAKGGIEIGLSLPSSTMHSFSSLFNHALVFMSSSTF